MFGSAPFWKERALTFVAALNPRLGRDSPAVTLTPYLARDILMLTRPFHPRFSEDLLAPGTLLADDPEYGRHTRILRGMSDLIALRSVVPLPYSPADGRASITLRIDRVQYDVSKHLVFALPNPRSQFHGSLEVVFMQGSNPNVSGDLTLSTGRVFRPPNKKYLPPRSLINACDILNFGSFVGNTHPNLREGDIVHFRLVHTQGSDWTYIVWHNGQRVVLLDNQRGPQGPENFCAVVGLRGNVRGVTVLPDAQIN